MSTMLRPSTLGTAALAVLPFCLRMTCGSGQDDATSIISLTSRSRESAWRPGADAYLAHLLSEPSLILLAASLHRRCRSCQRLIWLRVDNIVELGRLRMCKVHEFGCVLATAYVRMGRSSGRQSSQHLNDKQTRSYQGRVGSNRKRPQRNIS